MKIYDVKMKIIKTLLVIVSLWMLTQNYLVVCDNYDRTWSSKWEYVEFESDILNIGVNYLGIDTKYMAIHLAEIEDVLEYIGNGKFSAFETSEILITGKFYMPLIWNMYYLNELYYDGYQIFSYMFQIVLYLSIILGCLVVGFIWIRGEMKFDKLYMMSHIGLLVFAFAICVVTYEWFGVAFLRPTLCAIIAFICAAPITARKMVEELNKYGFKKKKQEPHKDVSSKVELWKCKSCNTENESNIRFCPSCGKKKSEIVICEKCGAKKWDDEDCKFCKQNREEK